MMLVNASGPCCLRITQWVRLEGTMSTALAVIITLHLSNALSLASGLSCKAGCEQTDLLQPPLQFLNFPVYPFHCQLVHCCL